MKPKYTIFGHIHIWYICPPPPKNFFLFLYFLVSRFQNFGAFFENVPSWNGRNKSESIVENEEPSDSIGIIIAVIIDVNY